MRACLLSLAILIGCGGSDDPKPDAPTGLVGLGQVCGLDQDVCPAETPRCLITETGGFNGFCSKTCIETGTFSTTTESKPQNITPPLSSGNDGCAALYSGSIGTAACAVTFSVMPALPLEPNTSYMFKAGCAIKCGAANECPAELTCNTQLGVCIAP